MSRSAAQHLTREAVVILRPIVEMAKICIAVGADIDQGLVLESRAQALTVIPIAGVDRHGADLITMRVQESPETIALFDGVALFQIWKSEPARESGHSAEWPSRTSGALARIQPG